MNMTDGLYSKGISVQMHASYSINERAQTDLMLNNRLKSERSICLIKQIFAKVRATR